LGSGVSGPAGSGDGKDRKAQIRRALAEVEVLRQQIGEQRTKYQSLSSELIAVQSQVVFQVDVFLFSRLDQYS
jgi:archaellum component FlaC